MAAVRRTALYERHLAAGGRMVDFAGWEMPLQYSSVKAEQQAVRAATGIFDVSHMGRLEVQGQGSLEFLQGLVTNDLSKLLPDQAQYNLLCREDGGIVDDLVVYRAALPLRSAPTLPSPTRGEGILCQRHSPTRRERPGCPARSVCRARCRPRTRREVSLRERRRRRCRHPRQRG